jgi:hypothetical protein
MDIGKNALQAVKRGQWRFEEWKNTFFKNHLKKK